MRDTCYNLDTLHFHNSKTYSLNDREKRVRINIYVQSTCMHYMTINLTKVS